MSYANGDKIRDYLVRTHLVDFQTDGVDDQTDLMDAGIVDSFTFMQLVGFLEKEFDIKISNNEIASDRLRSLAGIHAFVADKLGR